ncbi:prion-like-(Q/N-rich) domain-bearing protein 25 isoform X2 [Solenopsis invicta]|uniref:prion-like-(Q/N-rich) domain-bearing protein 25 isoform X2 n=1 Tax=Solenopsis invicta TaxID=13686 RepID=UPI000595A46F|nr:prion-like-(Q/N-rich) domain-bearing protein 25 isoform X2 [Solenopsis invicta]
MSPAGTRTCVILGAIILAISLTNGDYKHAPLVYRTCRLNQDCNFPGGICNDTIRQCVCSKNYVPADNGRGCVLKADSIEASCTDENQCLAFLANTTCENNKCVCKSDYYYVDKACWKMVEYDEPCTKNEECSHIEGSICTDDMTCRCAAEMVLNTNNTKCLPAAKEMQDECTESIQCEATFEFSICVDEKCQCDQNFHYERELTRCFFNKAIGDECANDYECYQAEDYENDPPIKSMICNSNICTCADNYTFSENKCVNAGSSVAVISSLILSVIALIILS